jgi:hypothetical protein
MVRRGLRITGAESLLEGIMAHHTPNQIGGEMARDIVGGQVHPWTGPAVSFATTALTGHDTGGRQIANRAEDAGLSQNYENIKAATSNLNPVLASGFGIKDQPLHSYGKNLLDQTLKAPAQAAGVKSVYPPRSAAEQMVSDILRSRMAEGMTVEEKDKAAIKAMIKQDIKTQSPDLSKQEKSALESGLITQRGLKTLHKNSASPELSVSAKYLDPKLLARVIAVATPAEKKLLDPILADKLAREQHAETGRPMRPHRPTRPVRPTRPQIGG